MDDTVIDMRDVFLKRKVKNLQNQDLRVAPDKNQELLVEISVALKIIMGDIQLHLIKNKEDRRKADQRKLRTIEKCCKEIDEFIKGNRV